MFYTSVISVPSRLCIVSMKREREFVCVRERSDLLDEIDGVLDGVG
jgi:hypothetical protein